MTDEATTPSGDSGLEGEAEIEVLAVEIESTRDEMTDTVQAIGTRLDPANVVQDAKDTVRDATIGRVEDMTSNAMETAADAGGGLLDTIRRNPIPAAMTAIGIGWLVMNRDDGRQSHRSDRAWRDSWRDQERHGYSGYGGSDRQGATERVGQTVDQVGRQAGRVADDVRATVGSTVGQLPDQVGSTARDVGWNAERMVQENPLALGAAAFAVGAAIGMALPATDMERNVLGGPAGNAIDTVERAASDAVREMETSNA